MASENSIGPWTIGSDLISFTISTAAYAPASNGTTFTTSGTPFECVGLVRRIQHQARVTAVDIRPITQNQENMVPISIGHSLQLVNLRVNNAANVFAHTFAAGFYVQVIFQDGVEQYDGFYLITGFESGFDGNAEQVQSLDLAPIALTSRGQVERSVGP